MCVPELWSVSHVRDELAAMSIALESSPTTDRAATAARDDLVLGGAVVGTGLVAGLLYGYACSVMPGLHSTSDATTVEAMQHINRAIQNPAFFASFLGAPLLSALAWRGERRRGDRRAARLIGAGVALTALTLGVTFAANIPLNEALDHARAGDAAQAREAFEGPWVAWNLVRTVTSIAAFGCLAWGARLRLLARRPV
jgi:uncharacterized membrane protein